MFLSLTLGCDLANVVQWDVTVQTSGDGIEAIMDTQRGRSCLEIIGESSRLGLVVTPRPGLLEFASSDWIQVFKISFANWWIAESQALRNFANIACAGQTNACLNPEGQDPTNPCNCAICDLILGHCSR